jgi:hypothetical protein
VSKDFSDRLAGYFVVSNVTDTDYEERLGDPRAGLTVRLGADFRL